MKINKLIQTAAACLISGSVMAAGTPVDLTGWIDNGTGGNWTVQAGNDSVSQSLNSETPTIFHNNMNSQGLALSGEITVQTTSDDDFIGFVLGYNNNDVTNGMADYILIDWKQGDQTDQGGFGQEGLAISRVQGALQPNGGSHGANDAWSHDGVVTELARANTLGSTGWLDNTKYSFDLIFTSTQIQVSVNGLVELSIAGMFNNGSFGFYNFSQANVLYAGIEERTAPPIGEVPVPAAAFMFAPALLGFLGLRRRKTSV